MDEVVIPDSNTLELGFWYWLIPTLFGMGSVVIALFKHINTTQRHNRLDVVEQIQQIASGLHTKNNGDNSQINFLTCITEARTTLTTLNKIAYLKKTKVLHDNLEDYLKVDIEMGKYFYNWLIDTRPKSQKKDEIKKELESDYEYFYSEFYDKYNEYKFPTEAFKKYRSNLVKVNSENEEYDSTFSYDPMNDPPNT